MEEIFSLLLLLETAFVIVFSNMYILYMCFSDAPIDYPPIVIPFFTFIRYVLIVFLILQILEAFVYGCSLYFYFRHDVGRRHPNWQLLTGS
jgi:hypothetical protein